MPAADHKADIATLRQAREDFHADYQTGRVSALDYVQAGNILAEAKKTCQ